MGAEQYLSPWPMVHLAPTVRAGTPTVTRLLYLSWCAPQNTLPRPLKTGIRPTWISTGKTMRRRRQAVVAEEPPGRSPPEERTWRQVAESRSGVDPLATTTVAQAMLRTPRLVPESEPLAGVYARLDERGQSLMVVNGLASWWDW